MSEIQIIKNQQNFTHKCNFKVKKTSCNGMDAH